MGKVYGYARVSSISQSLELQVAQLTEAGCTYVFQEKKSGSTTAGRDELAKALEILGDGDTLVVTRLDRLARSILDFKQIMDRLAAKNVGFRAVQQGTIDTTTSEGRLLLNILSSFAEFELDIRKERQRDGIARAKDEDKKRKANGLEAETYRGRPAKIDSDKIAKLVKEGLGASAIAKRLNIGRASVYRVQKPKPTKAA
jgi:DNA invertase Pin-like site-specific DNA recombinase